MLERLKTTLRPPVFADDEKTFAASLVHIMAWTILLAVVIYTLLAPIAVPNYGLAWLYVLGVAAVMGGTLWLLGRGLVQASTLLLVSMLWLILTLAAYFNGGVLAPAYGGYVIVVLIGGLLLGWRTALALVFLSAGAGAVMLALETAGQLPEWRSTYEAAAMWGTQLVYLLVAALLLTLALRALKRALLRARQEFAERLQTEQALLHSEQRFRAIFDAINDAVFIQDLADGHIVDVNQTMCDMYGYTKNEARRLSIEDLSAGYVPYTERDAAAHWTKSAAGPQVFEWLAKDRQGCLFWVEVNMRRAMVGEHERLLVVVRNIDERKRAIEAERQRAAQAQFFNQQLLALAQSEAISSGDLTAAFATITESMAQVLSVQRVSVWQFSADGNELLLSDLYEEPEQRHTHGGRLPHSGRYFAALLTDRVLAIDDVTADARVADFIENYFTPLAITSMLDAPIRLRGRTVGVICHEQVRQPRYWQPEERILVSAIADLLAVALEAHERRRAEEALRQREAYLRSILDNLPYLAWLKDVDGRFLAVNRVFAESAGQADPEVLIGKTDLDFYPHDLAEKFRAEDQLVMRQGVQYSTEEATRAHGAERWYETYKLPIWDEAGRVIGTTGVSRDITDRKQLEMRGQRLNQYLRQVIEAARELMDCSDLDELCRRAVELGRQRLGLERCSLFLYDEARAQLVGTYGIGDDGQTADEHSARLDAQDRAELLIPPDQLWLVKQNERTDWDDQTARLSESGWTACTLLRGRGRINGVLYNDALLSGAPLDKTQQEVTAVYCSMLGNLVELKRTEEAVRESEALFRNLADNAPAMITLTDEAGEVVYLNRAWQEFCGSAAPAPLADRQARFHPGDRDRYSYEFEAARQARRKYDLEYRLRRSDGQYRWLFDTSVPRFTVAGQFAGFISMAIDITDRKNAEEALLRSEARLRLVTENMEDSVSQIDAAQRFVYVSPSMERMSGYAPRELLGRPFTERVHPDDAMQLQHQILMASDLRLPNIRLEYRFRQVDGHEIWLEAAIRFMYNTAGELAGAIVNARDIALRKQAELDREKLIRELEDKNAELERFTYTVSHDLKSPLITIRGFLGFLEKDARAGNFDRLHTDLQRISAATNRMQRLLDDLVELSRIGRVSNPSQEIPFAVIVRDALDLVRDRLEASNIHVEVAPNLPTVYGDQTRLVEVVQNLVDNAAKFMGSQPEPRITIGLLGERQAEMPIFFVQDNGIGIEPVYHERIFGLFNKLDVQSEGTGVGLTLVKRIIDMQNGHIWVESDGLGQGTTFFFTLPLPPVAESD